jgi:hypothetical protein
VGAITQTVGTRTAVTVTGFSSLAVGAYCVSAAIVPNTNKPVEVVVDVGAGSLDPPTGNKRILVYVQESLDGVNYRKGPTGGTSAAEEVKLLPLGVLEMGSDGDGRAMFPVARALGFVPHSFKVVLKNEAGSALALGNLYVSEISMSVA